MAGFWSGVWRAITGRGSGDLPVARPPAPGPPIDVTPLEQPPTEPGGQPERPEREYIDPEIEYWMALGANRQEAETLVILHDRFDAYPSFDNWIVYARAQEEIDVQPDWAEFREKYEGSLA